MSDDFEAVAQHYARLSRIAGWREYCQHKVRELEKDDSGLFVGLLDRVREIITCAA